MNPLKEGSRVPSVTFRTRKDGDWRNLTSDEICAGKAVVVFSLPGAVFVNGQHIGGLDELRDWAKKAAWPRADTLRTFSTVAELRRNRD